MGFKLPLLTSDDPTVKYTKLAAVIAHCRLARMVTMGMFFKDGLSGSAWGDWALYTASPLRILSTSPACRRQLTSEISLTSSWLQVPKHIIAAGSYKSSTDAFAYW